jgi:hypothetical protein
MPFLPLIAMAAIQTAPPAPTAPPLAEASCSYLVGDRAHPTVAEDPNLHVLMQTAADGQFAPTPPTGAIAVACSRASIVPGAHDEEAILAHLALIITESTGTPPRRAGMLGFDGSHFVFRMRTGTLTAAEQAAVDARLAEYLARVRPSSAAAH